MSGDLEVVRQALAWAEGGGGAALATVVATWGSAPRPAGSHLAVSRAGAFVGSVSGGCIEAAVVAEAAAVLADGRPRLRAYGVSDERAWSLGLACGGTIEVLVERAEAARLSPLVAAVEAGGAAVVATELGAVASGGAAPARLLRLDPAGDGGPGAVAEAQPEADGAGLLAQARAAAAEDRSRRWDGPAGPVFLRAWNPPVRVVVVGAVHVAQPLSRMVRDAGYELLVVDPRQAFATPERFPGVDLSTAWPEEALRAARLDRRTAVVALTHDPKLDDPALAEALRSPAFYVGALGSRRSHAARRARLAALGFADVALDRIHGPVGLPLGAVSPGEIAVAILAEVVGCLRRPGG